MSPSFSRPLVGGIYAIILLLLRLRLQGTLIRLSTMFSSLLCGIGLNGLSTDKMRKTPVLNYGVAIAIGVFISIVWNLYDETNTMKRHLCAFFKIKRLGVE